MIIFSVLSTQKRMSATAALGSGAGAVSGGWARAYCSCATTTTTTTTENATYFLRRVLAERRRRRSVFRQGSGPRGPTRALSELRRASSGLPAERWTAARHGSIPAPTISTCSSSSSSLATRALQHAQTAPGSQRLTRPPTSPQVPPLAQGCPERSGPAAWSPKRACALWSSHKVAQCYCCRNHGQSVPLAAPALGSSQGALSGLGRRALREQRPAHAQPLPRRLLELSAQLPCCRRRAQPVF